MNSDLPPENNFRNFKSEKKKTVWRHNSTWLWGITLIVLGIVFLLQQTGTFDLHNWWALFILIPAFGAFINVYRYIHSSGGHFTAAARSALVGGLILTLVALIFLLDLNWGVMWPWFLIIIGVGGLLGALAAKDRGRKEGD